jgi:hypothetical protein
LKHSLNIVHFATDPTPDVAYWAVLTSPHPYNFIFVTDDPNCGPFAKERHAAKKTLLLIIINIGFF